MWPPLMVSLCILCWKSKVIHATFSPSVLSFFFSFSFYFLIPISHSLSLSPLPTHRSSRCCRCHLSIRTMLKLRYKISKLWLYFLFFFHLSFVGNQVILYLFLLSNFRWRWIMKLWQTFCVISRVDVGIFMWGCWGHFVQFMFVIFCTQCWALFFILVLKKMEEI